MTQRTLYALDKSTMCKYIKCASRNSWRNIYGISFTNPRRVSTVPPIAFPFVLHKTIPYCVKRNVLQYVHHESVIEVFVYFVTIFVNGHFTKPYRTMDTIFSYKIVSERNLSCWYSMIQLGSYSSCCFSTSWILSLCLFNSSCLSWPVKCV